MATPEQMEDLSLFTMNLYNSIEAEILYRIGVALRMPQDLQQGDIVSWQMQKLTQLGVLENEAYAIIARHAGMTVDAVKQAINEAAEIGTTVHDTALKAVGIAVMANTGANVIAGILSAYQAQAVDLANFVNTTMLDKTKQVYRDIVNETTAKVLTGLRTPQQALRETARKWLQNGIPSITDKSGRRWSTEGYVNMLVRSTSKTVSNDMQLSLLEQYNIDLIEVSSHTDARPKCARDQGRIYSKSGKAKTYPAWTTTTYGQPDGLLGINCRHVIYPFVHGKSTRRYYPIPLDKTNVAYKQSQTQRKLERGIRKQKKQLQLMQGLGDAKGISEAKERLALKQKDMREFIAQTGRTRRRNREQLAV